MLIKLEIRENRTTKKLCIQKILQIYNYIEYRYKCIYLQLYKKSITQTNTLKD